MLNPIQNAEAIYSATYVDNYIDSVENLPDDVSRILSRIRDIDVQYRTYLRDVDHYYDLWKSLQNGGDTLAKKRQSAVSRMQQSLIQAQELGDEKMQIVNQLQEIIDFKTRQLDTDQKNLDIKEELAQPHRLEQLQSHADDCSGPTQSKQTRTQSPAPISGSANGGNSVNLGGAVGSVSSGGGSSTPNSDRSSHVSNSAHNFNANSSGISTNANNSSALIGSETYRSASKRSRRRNENANNNMHAVSSGLMELGGNESNSANEGGGSNGGGGSERHASQKTNSGASQKNQSASGSTASAAGSSAVGAGAGSGSKKKKRKARATQSSVQANVREDTPPDPIDPDEPTYCVCNQISFGEMILCDNDLCPIEWFHFSCVSLVLKPKGRWYCPNCRGDRPNVMKPKAQFLKELERYNKEKEEKT